MARRSSSPSASCDWRIYPILHSTASAGMKLAFGAKLFGSCLRFVRWIVENPKSEAPVSAHQNSGTAFDTSCATVGLPQSHKTAVGLGLHGSRRPAQRKRQQILA